MSSLDALIALWGRWMSKGAQVKVGTVLRERYVLDEVLGEGTTAVVYRARDLRFRAAVAVKAYKAQPSSELDEELRSRFIQEAQVMAQLSHPHVARLLDYGALEDGALFMVQELAQGPSIQTLLRPGPIESYRAVRIMRQVAAGLAGAHTFGVFHRDLKPANIIICDVIGLGAFAKVVDFGLAQLAPSRREGQARLTRPGSIYGTPQHMAPEQIHGAFAKAQTDVYGLGSTLFMMVTARAPFESDSIVNLLIQKQEKPAPLASSVMPGLSPDLDRLIDRCLQMEPSNRPASMLDLIQDFDELLARGENPTDPKLKLMLLGAPSPGHRLSVQGAYHLVGRQSPEDGVFPSIDLSLLDGPSGEGGISRKHCELHHREGVWWVVDLGAANGTFLDGVRLSAGQAVAVGAGQQLKVGRLGFRVEML